MYKGYKRRVIVVKETGSRLFDAAYFVVRDGMPEDSIQDMVEEASRIINSKISEESCPASYKRLLAFSLGVALASVIFAATVLVLS